MNGMMLSRSRVVVHRPHRGQNIHLQSISRPFVPDPSRHVPIHEFGHHLYRPRAKPNNRDEEGQEVEEEVGDAAAAAASTAFDSFIQAGILLTAAGVASSSLGIEWDWTLPDNAMQTAAICSFLPVAFTVIVCATDHKTGPVVRLRSFLDPGNATGH